jgi:hypothetical protein
MTMAVVPSARDAGAHPAAVDGVGSGVDVRGGLGDPSVAHGEPAPGG